LHFSPLSINFLPADRHAVHVESIDVGIKPVSAYERDSRYEEWG